MKQEMNELTESRKLNSEWSKIWSETSVLREINLRDFYGLRPYILKYLPRKGQILEAGCGLGRYVFYLSDLGFDVRGVDVAKYGLRECKSWAKKHRYDYKRFEYADVREISYPDNYFSGYLSLGVIEHFQEGPDKALSEAFRILKPGGIAIIDTPNKYSLELCFLNLVRKFGFLVPLFKKSLQMEFFQYEYSLKELDHFVKKACFDIIEKRNINLKYPIYRLFKLSCMSLRLHGWIQPILFPILDHLENTFLRLFSGISLVVVYKPAKKLCCFFCGEINVLHNSFKCSDFLVPICPKCLKYTPENILSAYKKDKQKIFLKSKDYKRLSDSNNHSEKCFFCKKDFTPNKYFKDYGFAVSICQKCLKDPIKNLEASNFYLKFQWPDIEYIQ